MSWINKRRGQTTPSPSPAQGQVYNPYQHSNLTQENQWQQQQLQNSWYAQQQQLPPKQENTPWQQQSYNNTLPQQPQYQNTQQFGQYVDQTAYYQNNTGYQQQPHQPMPTTGNMQYSQQYNQNNLYPNQQTQQTAEGDAWNWGWGDEDNSNLRTTQHEVTSAGNNLGESDVKWNWSLDEPQTNQSENKVGQLVNNMVKTENDPEVNKAAQDHLAVTGKRGKLETPQWSVESQMSQESSDDILHTSESDKMISRSSTVSHSPISGQDVLPNTLSHNLEDVPVKQEPNYKEEAGSSLQFENKEILSNVKQEVSEMHSVVTRVNPTPLLKRNPTPPPPKNTPPLLTAGSSDDLKNPYKRTTGLSHKAASKFRTTNITPPDARQNVYQPNFHNQNVNLETLPDNSEQPDPVPTISSNIVSKQNLISSKKPLQQWPENNEAPINDRNQYLETGQLSDSNLHSFIQPNDNGVKHESNDALPPPGLRRMVLGQMEQTENLNVTNLADEPPPGLSRMVLGQTESNLNPPTIVPGEDLRLQYESVEPPEGLRRMVPGESSSPESTLRHQQPRQQDEDSEPEFNQLISHAPQQRSATIGADTPPVDSMSITTINSISTTNRSETIGGGHSGEGSTSQDTNLRQRGLSGSSSENRNNKSDKKTEQPISENGRRDPIEGQTQDQEVLNIINSVRNLTVGENVTDDHISNKSTNDITGRRPSREESSDSEEPKRIHKSSRDKRHIEKSKHRDKDRERDRYTPESYKDKKHDKRRQRDRRYEDDTEDYYTDKERDRRRNDRDRDYDKKYSGLRKDKDKDKRRRDYRDADPRDSRRDYGRDSRRNEYYYSKYDDDYDDDRGSRPTSRSDSMHESYRDRGHERDPRDRRNRERDRDRYRRLRDPRDSFNPYQGYDPYNPYYQQYQYYENLRRTNPQAYAEWYRKYYQQAAVQSSGYGAEDRASVHSGRSSANDELAKDRYTRQSYYSQSSLPHMGGYYGDTHTHSISGHFGLDNSSFTRPFDNTDSSLNFEDNNMVAQRMTPMKFSTAHIKASISSGKLVRFLPTYPLDGQNPIVEICSIPSLLENDDEFKELNRFPGPLVKGVSHKKTIIEYCENKIKGANYNLEIVDADSYVLMWELLILLIRQNGMVVGTDIAELLLKNRSNETVIRPPSVISNLSSNVGDVNLTSEASNQPNSEGISGSTQSVLKEEEVTNKFREYLLFGSCKESLEWAMKHGLWGHALFLASKLDKRTYANVMMRFANGLTINDPLQTLYQLLSGRVPAAVTCVSDEKWGDWRPHLAMILSNSTQRPELNCKAIATLGETLMNRGSLYAAQFCYLMAQVGFSKHTDPDAKLALLGSDHKKPFSLFATNEAIHMTEIYEYACSLNDPQFILPEFQVYKYLLATRLADRGLLEKSLAYLERISGYIVSNPSAVSLNFVDNVCSLADRLKFYDPVGDIDVDESEFGGILETSRPDNSWLKELRTVQNDYKAGLITQENIQNYQQYTESYAEDPSLQQTYDSSMQNTWQQQYDQQQQFQQQNVQQWQPESQLNNQIDNQQNSQLQENDQYQDQQQFWPNQQQWNEQPNQFNQETVDQQQNFYGSNTNAEDATPQISMPNQQKGKSPYDDAFLPSETAKKDSPVKQMPQQTLPEKPVSTGWFGGIFSKLSRKPNNQMKLPDDKNPKIVWDQEKKRWINLDDDGNDVSSELKPPPKSSDLMPKVPTAVPVQNNPPVANFPITLANTQADLGTGPADESNEMKSLQPNMFKLQRGRNLKKSYIDVFNPNGKSSGPTSLPDALPPMLQQTPQMNFFTPQPINDPNAPTDFLTPAPPLQFNDNSQPQ